MEQVVQQVALTRGARQMRAKNNAFAKLREMYPADYEKLYIEEAVALGINPHALTRSKTIANLEMKLAKLKGTERVAQ
jgi:hypothetical protein